MTEPKTKLAAQRVRIREAEASTRPLKLRATAYVFNVGSSCGVHNMNK